MNVVRIHTVSGKHDDHVAEDQRVQRVVEMEAIDHRVEGAEDRDLRKDRHRQHQVERRRAAPEAKAPEGVSGQRSEGERDDRDRAGDDRRVDQRTLKVAARQHSAEVGPGRIARPVLHGRPEQLGVRGERGPHRPVEREPDVHDDDHDQQEEWDALHETPATATPHPRARLRSRRGFSDRAHCSSTLMNVT